MEVSGCSNDGDFGHRGARGACGGVSPCLERVRSRRVDARRVNARVAQNVAIRRRLRSACNRIRDAAQGLDSPPCARIDALHRDSAPSGPARVSRRARRRAARSRRAARGRSPASAASGRKVRRRSSTPKYPSADRQRARGRRRERNRDLCRHAPVTTDTSGRVYDWRARRRREAVPARLEFRRTTLPDREGRRFAR